MHVLIADLHKNAAALGEQIAHDGQPVAEVREIRVDAILPGIAESLHLFGLSRDLVQLAVLDVAGTGGDLPVGIELDAIGGVEIDALHLAPQRLPLGQAGHDLQAVAQDHAVLPVLVMGVELGLRLLVDAVEVGVDVVEQVGGVSAGLGAFIRMPFQVIDDGLGVDLFLDIEGRGLDNQVRPVLLVLAAPGQFRLPDFQPPSFGQFGDLLRRKGQGRAFPDDLRVQILIALSSLPLGQGAGAGVGHGTCGIGFLHPLERGCQFRCGYVAALRGIVGEGLDLFRQLGLSGHLARVP